MSTNSDLTKDERLKEALRIIHIARGAIGKINVERKRGAGYYHAEVDWLLREEENINKLLKESRNE